MPFNEVPTKGGFPGGGRGNLLRDTVRATLRLAGKDGRRVPTLRLTFSADVVAQLGWVEGDRLRLAFGDGPDLGSFLVRRPHPSEADPRYPALRLTGKAGRGPRASSTLHIATARLPEDLLSRVDLPLQELCAWRARDGQLLLSLPNAQLTRSVPDTCAEAA